MISPKFTRNTVWQSDNFSWRVWIYVRGIVCVTFGTWLLICLDFNLLESTTHKYFIVRMCFLPLSTSSVAFFSSLTLLFGFVIYAVQKVRACMRVSFFPLCHRVHTLSTVAVKILFSIFSHVRERLVRQVYWYWMRVALNHSMWYGRIGRRWGVSEWVNE